MARLNGMGPNGQGPLTGRGMGNCVGGQGGSGGFSAGLGRGGAGMGMGLGRGGRGSGMGMGRGARRCGFWGFGAAPLDSETEKEVLKRQASSLEAQLDGIQKRLDGMDKE
jgi:hypothetical protein